MGNWNCLVPSRRILPELHRSAKSFVGSFRYDKNAYSSAERRLIQQYLPHFNYATKSTVEQRELATWHWNLVFKDLAHDSQRSSGRRATTKLYTAFSAYMDEHYPQLKTMLTSVIPVRGRVLSHIGRGIGTLLNAPAAAVPEYIAFLTHTHLRVGVKPELFDPLGQALIHAMGQVSSAKYWTSEIEEAWRYMFCHVSVLLLAVQCAIEQNHKHGPAAARAALLSLTSTTSVDSATARLWDVWGAEVSSSSPTAASIPSTPSTSQSRTASVRSTGRRTSSLPRLLPVDETEA